MTYYIKMCGNAHQVFTEALIYTAHSLGICSEDLGFKKISKYNFVRCGLGFFDV